MIKLEITMTSKFSNLKLNEVKAELRLRNAKLSGRKEELIERLDAYEKSKNFGKSDEEGPDYQMSLPEATKYRDVNSETFFCDVSVDGVVNYIQQFEKNFIFGRIQHFYNELFLLYFRLAMTNFHFFFIKNCCHAEQKGKVTYAVDIMFDKHGNILESQCECAAGMGPSAHCKHVCTVLYGCLMFIKNKTIKTEQTCTQKLQTFHKSKKIIGSPVKTHKLDVPGADQFTTLDYDPRPASFRNQLWYTHYFRNTCLNFKGISQTPIFQLFQPANAHAVAHDHDYGRLTPEDNFLEVMSVTSITSEEILAIERRTLGQGSNKQWEEERTKRLTSSTFGRICKAVLSDKTDCKKLAQSMVIINSINTSAIEHGKRYEEQAVVQYMSMTGEVVHKCGIVVSKENPFLSCSPDGIINDNKIVEVKCPYSAKDKTISHLSVPYLRKIDNGGFSLNPKHDYYHQIQGQLLCTGAYECVMVVYTITDLVHFTVVRDEPFINQMVSSLTKFFHEYFKPALLEKRYYKSFVN